MSVFRKLADRLTGQEAARAAEIERRRCEKLRASDRSNHAHEIQQLRLAALDQGVWLFKAIGTWVDVTTVEGGERQIPGTWEWQAVPMYESSVEAGRNLLLGSEGRREAPSDRCNACASLLEAPCPEGCGR